MFVYQRNKKFNRPCRLPGEPLPMDSVPGRPAPENNHPPSFLPHETWETIQLDPHTIGDWQNKGNPLLPSMGRHLFVFSDSTLICQATGVREPTTQKKMRRFANKLNDTFDSGEFDRVHLCSRSGGVWKNIRKDIEYACKKFFNGGWHEFSFHQIVVWMSFNDGWVDESKEEKRYFPLDMNYCRDLVDFGQVLSLFQMPIMIGPSPSRCWNQPGAWWTSVVAESYKILVSQAPNLIVFTNPRCCHVLGKKGEFHFALDPDDRAYSEFCKTLLAACRASLTLNCINFNTWRCTDKDEVMTEVKEIVFADPKFVEIIARCFQTHHHLKEPPKHARYRSERAQMMTRQDRNQIQLRSAEDAAAVSSKSAPERVTQQQPLTKAPPPPPKIDAKTTAPKTPPIGPTNYPPQSAPETVTQQQQQQHQQSSASDSAQETGTDDQPTLSEFTRALVKQTAE